MSYRVAATGSGSAAPARTISVSSRRGYDWRLYETARTDDQLARATGNHGTGSCWTIRPGDCGGTGVFGLDGAQMAPPGSTPGTHRPGFAHGSPHHWATQHSSAGDGPYDLASASDTSRLGPDTLLAELRVDPRWAHHCLPSRSRIGALLKAEKLTRRYQKHSDLPSPPSHRRRTA